MSSSIDLPQNGCNTTIISRQNIGFIAKVTSPEIGKVNVRVHSLIALLEKANSTTRNK